MNIHARFVNRMRNFIPKVSSKNITIKCIVLTEINEKRL